MGRTSDARERLLEAGERLFGERSYGAIGVAEISATAGAPKGSFYYYFPSKQEFAVAVIDEHWRRQKAEWSSILSSEGSTVDRLHRLFEATAAVQREAQAGVGAVAGCMFGNLALELSSTEPVIRERLQEIFETQVDMIAAVLGDERRDMATAVVANLEGLVLLAKLRNDPSLIESQWVSTARMLKADVSA